MKKKLLSAILTACMVLTLLPAAALAAAGTYGDFTVTYDGTAPTYTDNTMTLGTGTYTISGTTTSGKIVVASGSTANITLNGLTIDLSATKDCAFDMAGATVNLTLSGSNMLTGGKTMAGLRVTNNATLTVTGTSTDSLEATSTSFYPDGWAQRGNGAGIGGNGCYYYGEDCGTVTINGGNVTATGGGSSGGMVSGGAGIGGGGSWVSRGGAGGTVTINGGTVTATGGGQDIGCGAAGIGGGGSGGSGGTVTINGGNVTATGGATGDARWPGAAGIGGGGRDGNGGTVTITGGSVKATCGSGGPIGMAIGSVGAGTPGSLTNGSTNGNAPVSLYTLTLTGVTSATAVTALTTSLPLGYTYGTNDMKTDTDGKLYVYLPASKTAASVTAGGTNFNATSPDFTAGYTISGTVSAGAIAASVSGLTVNLYASSDTTFSTALCSATTNGSGEYAISGIPYGKYVARVAGVFGSYAASVSDTITVSDGPVSGANVTLTALTTQSIAVKAGSQKISYIVNEPLDVANLVITVTRNDGSTYEKNVTAAMVAGFDSSSFAASQTLTITFDDKTATYSISVNRMEYGGTPAPAPALSSKTDIRAVLSAVTVADQTVEYGKSTSNTTPTAWQDSPIFTDLTANTIYYFFARVKQTDTTNAGGVSSVLAVTTKAASASVPVPDKPVIGTDENKPTSSSITVSVAAGNEYYISESATANWSGTPNGYFKAAANGTHKFDGLTPGTQYYIHVRAAETDTSMPSASAYAAQYTLPETPIAGVGYSVDYAAEKITISSGYEVNTSIGFGASTAVLNNVQLAPGTTYYVRLAAKDGVPASAASSFAIPARPAAPAAVTTANITKTKAAITISNTVAGQEYQVNGTWYTPENGTVVATGLAVGTDYPVVTRVKATESSFAGISSDALTVKTKTDGNTGFALPTISVTPTYAPGKTLNDIALPTGWTWDAPATVPTVINTGYGAIYTPTDTDTVDYSGVTGYAVDGSGKVTITRVVPLTVNRATPTAADFTFTAPGSLNFSNTEKTATVTAKAGISGMGTVAVRYYLDGVETAPKAAGTYTVKIDLPQGNNYAAASAVTDSSWTFTIAKATQASLSIKNKPASVTYGDTFTLAAEGGSGEGLVTWAVTSGSSATVNANTGVVTITGVGETTITATKAADGNYANAVTATYTFTPAKRLIKVNDSSATGGWTKVYDGKEDFDPSGITVGGITNKVGSDAVNVTVQSAAYNTADVGSGDKTLTITYAIDGEDSENYLAPANTVISTASITAAAPAITLKSKTAAFTDKKTEIGAATVKGVEGGTTPDGAITYTYYTKGTCADADKTSVDKSGAETGGGAPKAAGTYFVKASIAASGNYTAATSAAVTLTIYVPSSGEDKASSPVIVDGKAVDMGTTEVKDGTTTVTVDQNKMHEQLENARDSVVIPITTKTDTASAQLVVQNVENMAARSMTLTVKADDVSYEIPTGSVDTAAILKKLGASDSSKVPLTVTISKLSNNAVTIKDGTLMVTPVAFTITAAYNGKSVEVQRFESYVQRVLEIPSGVDPNTITTAVVAETNGTQRHVPTDVYSEGGKWYAKISSMTNSTYALIQSSASFTDTTGKWYAAAAAEMASRKVLSGIGENMFAGDRSITRAEFAAILIRALGLPADGTSTFSDVSSSAWYSGAVATAAQYGLVTGKGLNRFAPNASITRQEAMTMLQSAAKLAHYSGTSGSLAGFTDAKSVGAWAQGAAKWSVGSGLIVGSGGLLRPNDTITRAECAAVILRLLQKAELVDVRS